MAGCGPNGAALPGPQPQLFSLFHYTCEVSLIVCVLVVLSPTKLQICGTLSKLTKQSGWPLDDLLVGRVIAERLKLDTGGAADFSAADIDGARKGMRMTKLETDYQLERKPPRLGSRKSPQFWVVDEDTRPGKGQVGREQLLAISKALLVDTDDGSDVEYTSWSTCTGCQMEKLLRMKINGSDSVSFRAPRTLTTWRSRSLCWLSTFLVANALGTRMPTTMGSR